MTHSQPPQGRPDSPINAGVELMNDQEAWRPIETAPKDGTRILVGRAGDMVGPDEIEITYWYEMERWHWEHVADDLYRKVQDEPCRSWNNNGGRATHWMPLPAAPKIQHSEGDGR